MKRFGETAPPWEEMQWRVEPTNNNNNNYTTHKKWREAAYMFRRLVDHKCSRLLFHRERYDPRRKLSHEGCYAYQDLMMMVERRRVAQRRSYRRLSIPLDLPELSLNNQVKILTISLDRVVCLPRLVYGYPNLETLVLAGVTSQETLLFNDSPATHLVAMCTRLTEIHTVKHIMTHMPNLKHLTLYSEEWEAAVPLVTGLHRVHSRVTELTMNLEVLIALAVSQIPKHLKKITIARTGAKYDRYMMEAIARGILISQNMAHTLNFED